MSFKDLELHHTLEQGLDRAGYENPTALQVQVFGPALAGTDVIVEAGYGTGRLAAHLIPMLDRLLDHFGATVPRGLVLVPDNQAALQVREETDFLVGNALRLATLYGTTSIDKQRRQLDGGVDLIVATPEGLVTHLANGLMLGRLEMVVIDGLDAILDEESGEEAVEDLLEVLPEGRQTLVFATEYIDGDDAYLKRLTSAATRISGATVAPAQGLHLDRVEVAKDRKLSLVRHLLRSEEVRSAVIFARGTRTCERIRRFLEGEDRILRLHIAAMDGTEKTRVQDDFQEGKADILIVADEGASDLVVFGHSLLINFDLPDSYEVFIDRVGRRGMPSRATAVTSLIAPEERKTVTHFEKELGYPMEVRSVSGFDLGLAKRGGKGHGGRRDRGRSGGGRGRASGSGRQRGGGRQAKGTGGGNSSRDRSSKRGPDRRRGGRRPGGQAPKSEG